jgi:predicted RNA-binding protein with RPS1 domain
LGESENVVNEEKYVLSLVVTEVFGDGETGKSDTGTGTRGLVHLSENESSLGLVVVELNDTSFNHLVVKICEVEYQRQFDLSLRRRTD